MDFIKLAATFVSLAEGIHKLADAINNGAASIPGDTITGAAAVGTTTGGETAKKRGRPAGTKATEPAPTGSLEDVKNAIRDAFAADKAKYGPQIRDILIAVGAVNDDKKPNVEKVPAVAFADVTAKIRALLTGGEADEFGL